MEKQIVDSWEEAGIDIPYGRRGNFYMTCPKCSHTRRYHPNNRCLSVDTDLGVFNCHHCGWQGGVRAVMKGGTMERPKKVYVRPLPPVPFEVTDPLPQSAIDWFTQRGIIEQVVRRHDIVVTKHWFPQLEADHSCLAFPYYGEDGELVNVKYRLASKKLFTMEKDAEPIFYGLRDCSDATFVVVVEGEMDKLACAVSGIETTLSVPSGAPPEGSKPKLDYFASGEAIFDRVSKVIIATDGDGPGNTLADELARRIGLEKCWRVRWPDGCKDANDVLMRQGPDALYGVMADARPYPVAGIFTVDDVRERIKELYRNGVPQGYEVGLSCLQGNYVIFPGYLTVVTGIPSHGKSEFLDQIMLNLSTQYSWSFGVYSPEKWPWEEHVSTLAAKKLDKPFYSGPTERMFEEELDAEIDWLNERFFSISPDSPNIDEILAKALVLIRREGINGLVIDPWNTVENDRPAETPMHEYIGDCLLKIQNFARHHNIHIWLAAHPRKMNRFDKTEKQPIPDPYDIADSAMFYNRADYIICVWRDISDPYAPVQIITQKLRSRRFGNLGAYRVFFKVITGRYTDWNG